MKKVMIMVMGLLLTTGAWAEEDSDSSSFFESLRQKIESLTPKKKLNTSNSVGGVRSAQADADELYWKGERVEQLIDADELAAFEAALSQLESGDLASGGQALTEFLANYPQSQLRGDAEQALALVKEQPPVAAEPADAKPAGAVSE